MPEGDTIAWAANRIRPALVGRIPDEILTPQPRHAMDRWPERLAGRTVERVDTHGKHLFVRFEGGLTLHSHLGMVGYWRVATERRPWRGAWVIFRVDHRWVGEFNGPLLELMTDARLRSDRRLAGLGPDVLAELFDGERYLARLHADDPTRGFADALLDQGNVAGLGNIWKAEGCWEAAIDPWRALATITDAEALAVIEAVRPRMQRSAARGPRTIGPRVYKKTGQPCPRCGGTITARGQGDANRTTYWCPQCQR
ncbi:MAG TPA: DNA-formamidopyrimidine glycosylase family protein [Solirubrobacteraceae bacterium]|jgi:endonuclease-8